MTRSSVARRLADRLFEPAPASRLATLRVLVGGYWLIYLLVRARALCDFSRFDAGRFEPVGSARLLDAPLPDAVVWVVWAACVVGAVGFTAGYRFRWVAPLFALLLLWVTSYRNSWSMIFHNENLALLHVGVLALSPAGEALARSSAPRAASDDERFGWPIRLLSIVTVCTYVVAGVAKLRLSGLHWIDGDVLRGHIAADDLRKMLIDSVYSPLGLWLVRFHWPFAILSPLTLLLELGAPLALFGKRFAWCWVAAAWSFHVGVVALMAIAFPYPISGVAFASFMPVERIWRWRWLSPLQRWLSVPAPRGSSCTIVSEPLA